MTEPASKPPSPPASGVSVRPEHPASVSAADVATTIVANAILRMCISFYLLVVMGGS